MGISKKTVTVCNCDRCGYETNDRLDQKSYGEGSLVIRAVGKLVIQSGSNTWDSAEVDADYWLCLDCTKEFLKFMGGK